MSTMNYQVDPAAAGFDPSQQMPAPYMTGQHPAFPFGANPPGSTMTYVRETSPEKVDRMEKAIIILIAMVVGLTIALSCTLLVALHKDSAASAAPLNGDNSTQVTTPKK